MIFFGVRNTIKELHLGNYMYDQFIIYLVEICKGIVKLELNSQYISDYSIVEILKKSTALKHLDISACPKFSGIAFSEVEEIASKELNKIVIETVGPYEHERIKGRVTSMVP